MKRIFTNIMAAIVLSVSVLGLGVAAVDQVGATPVMANAVKEAQKGVRDAGGSSNTRDLNDFIKDIINMILFLIGVIAVIMIIIGGIKFVTSNGDQGQVTSAKNTVLYAVIGLVIAVMAYAIVNFVLTRL